MLHATARVRAEGVTSGSSGLDASRAGAALRVRTTAIRESDTHYERMRRRGADFGPAFRGVRRLWCGEDEALAEVELPSVLVGDDARTRMHPALLDACVQVVECVAETDEATLLVPLAVDSIRIHGWASRGWSYARLRRHGDGVTADVVVTGDEGELLAELRGVTLRPAPRETASAVALHELTWQPRPLATPNGGAGVARWLILTDRGGVGDDLARRLASHGHAVDIAPRWRSGTAKPGGALDRRGPSARARRHGRRRRRRTRPAGGGSRGDGRVRSSWCRRSTPPPRPRASGW